MLDALLAFALPPTFFGEGRGKFCNPDFMKNDIPSSVSRGDKKKGDRYPRHALAATGDDALGGAGAQHAQHLRDDVAQRCFGRDASSLSGWAEASSLWQKPPSGFGGFGPWRLHCWWRRPAPEVAASILRRRAQMLSEASPAGRPTHLPPK